MPLSQLLMVSGRPQILHMLVICLRVYGVYADLLQRAAGLWSGLDLAKQSWLETFSGVGCFLVYQPMNSVLQATQ